MWLWLAESVWRMKAAHISAQQRKAARHQAAARRGVSAHLGASAQARRK